MRRTDLRKTFGLMAVLLLLSWRSFGQATTAELSGTVQDASGAVVPGAQVIANNIATNIGHRKWTSNHFFVELPGLKTMAACFTISSVSGLWR
jgi:hypothetical protein